MESVAIYLAAGLAAGLVSGLFGVGGGLTVVPALVLALPYEGVAPGHIMHMAIGTSLAIMIFTAAVTTVWRHKRGDFDWPLFWKLASLVGLGGAIGAAVGDALDGTILRAIFIAFVAITILRDIWKYWLRPMRVHHRGTRQPSRFRVGRLSFLVHGVATGIVGALLGAGAAIITVPFLTRRGHSIQLASALSAGLSAIIGIAAGAGYVAGGLNESGLPSQAVGYLYLPAFAGIAIGALAGSPFGVWLSHFLSISLQQTLFIIYLCIVLTVMIVRLQA
jgi:uncharacterized membrane protein YfcA